MLLSTSYTVNGVAVRRGQTAVRGTAPSLLPSKSVTFGANECLLAVAAAPLDDAAGVKLKLLTKSASHGDLRGKPVVAIELCGNELSAKPAIQVGATKSVQVRWALYITDAAQATAAR